MTGDGLTARALRGTALALAGFGGAQILRLASNLVLTRLLFPEAFGLMALVQVFVAGLRLFSETGIRTAIIQNKRGDDPVFLNTAWTIQAGRGVFLWLCTCAIAYPAAAIYSAPMLLYLLPVVGLNNLVNGFTTTNIATMNRHLRFGRQTKLALGTQAVELIITVGLAWLMQSVWALVLGGLIGSVINTAIGHLYLPGIRNRFQLDRDVFRELFTFGRYIFLSTVVTFLISQGDRMILGGYVSLAELGIYNIGYFLGTLPIMLHTTVNGKIVFPLYRLKPASGEVGNLAKIFKARRLVMAGTLTVTVIMAFAGIDLVNLMYDQRYALAGPIVVLTCFSIVPRLVIANYSMVLLAEGDTKNFFILNATLAATQTVLTFVGVIWLGIFGVILAPALAQFLVNPLRVRFMRKYNARDWRADVFFTTVGLVVTGSACWLHWDEIVKLIG